MMSPNEINRGLYIKIEGEIFVVEDYQHIKPGKGGAFIKTRLRNIRLDTVTDRTFRDADRVEDIFVEDKKFLYQYHSGDTYHFMDQESFEEVAVDKKILGNSVGFLKDNTEISAIVYEGRIMTFKPPLFVNLKVVSTEPGIRGDTSKSGNKPAEMETGIIIQVPLFIDNGDVIKVDTRTGEYVERA